MWAAPVAVGAQHDLVEGLAGVDPHVDRRRRSRSAASATAPVAGSITGAVRRPVRRRGSTRASAHPAARSAAEVGGPGDVDLLDARGRARPAAIGARRCRACGPPAGPRGRRRVDAGGDRRPLGPEAHDVLAVEQRPAPAGRARRPGAGRPPDDGDATLPPKAPPLASGEPARRPARTTTRRSRGRRARPTTCAASPPSRRRGRRAGAGVDRRAAALHLAGRGARLGSVSPTAQPPAPSGTATSASAGAVSSANPPWPSATVGADAPGARRPRAWPARPRPSRSRARSGVADCRGERPRRRGSCATRCTGRGGRAGPARPRRGRPRRRPWRASAREPHDDPRRAEPALARAGGAEASRPRGRGVGREPVERGDRPAGDPPRPASRTRPGAGRRRAPCSTRTGPAGCSRPWPSARRAGRAARRAARRPSSGTSTGAPSTSSCSGGELTAVDHGRRIGSLRCPPDPSPVPSPAASSLGSGRRRRRRPAGGCGGDDGSHDGADHDRGADGDLALVQFFGGLPMLVAGAAVRAPFGVADVEGLLPVDARPRALTVSPHRSGRLDGRRSRSWSPGTPRACRAPYYPLEFTVGDPGIYTGRTEIDGTALEMAIKVDPAEDVRRHPGRRADAGHAPRPRPTTPRASTRSARTTPSARFHDVTVAEALAAGRPVAPARRPRRRSARSRSAGRCSTCCWPSPPTTPTSSSCTPRSTPTPRRTSTRRRRSSTSSGSPSSPACVLVGSDGKVAARLDTHLRRGRGRRGAGPPRLSAPVTFGGVDLPAVDEPRARASTSATRSASPLARRAAARPTTSTADLCTTDQRGR